MLLVFASLSKARLHFVLQCSHWHLWRLSSHCSLSYAGLPASHFSSILYLDVIKVINLPCKDNSPLSNLAIVKRLLCPRVTHVG